jgi:NAD(P)-dependent dehydrogenase (short-subunit alcohol dehydrogenase family)
MLKGKVVIITGSTGGVGRSVTSVFAKEEVNMLLTARKLEALEKLAATLDVPTENLEFCAADLTSEDNVQKLIDLAVSRWGGTDILINIAGGWKGGVSVQDLKKEDWHQTLNMNLLSAFLINRAVLPSMLSRGWGRIINFSSKAAEIPGQKQAAYNVAKAGVVALTRSIAAEYKKKGIAANAVLPSIIDTSDNRRSMPKEDFKRWVRPEELAELILFLCSEAGGSLNGASIQVYGRV